MHHSKDPLWSPQEGLSCGRGPDSQVCAFCPAVVQRSVAETPIAGKTRGKQKKFLTAPFFT